MFLNILLKESSKFLKEIIKCSKATVEVTFSQNSLISS